MNHAGWSGDNSTERTEGLPNDVKTPAVEELISKNTFDDQLYDETLNEIKILFGTKATKIIETAILVLERFLKGKRVMEIEIFVEVGTDKKERVLNICFPPSVLDHDLILENPCNVDSPKETSERLSQIQELSLSRVNIYPDSSDKRNYYTYTKNTGGCSERTNRLEQELNCNHQ